MKNGLRTLRRFSHRDCAAIHTQTGYFSVVHAEANSQVNK
jgi:hypothetical protein